MDPRTQNLAKIITRYSFDAQPREVFSLNGTTEAEPLICALYEELIKAGAYPVVQMMPEHLTETFFASGKPHHFDELSKYHRAMARSLDGTVRIYSSPNTRSLSKVNPKKQVRLARAMQPIKKILIKTKWVVTLFPTQAYAQEADMSLRDFENFVYSAAFADEDNPIAAWKALSRKQEKLISKLEGAETVRIVGPGTDLSMSIKGRTFINSPGTHNMPSGEIFTGPVETSVNGYIQYDFPVCNAGREIDGIRLVFKDGKVVEATAEKNQAFLRAMLETDPGAKRLGELGIGTNYRIQQFTKNILFDEKIGGTVHLALGSAYEETGAKNKSALHWDMIKDLRKGGELYIDGKCIQRDGKFLNRLF